MSEGDRVENLIKEWYWQGLPEGEGVPTPDCPPLTRLWRHLAEGHPLDEYAEHVGQCNWCQRVGEIILRECSRDRATASIESEPAAPVPHVRPRKPKTTTVLAGRPKSAVLKIGGLAVAACVLIGFLVFWPDRDSGRAHAMDWREVGFALPLPVLGMWADPSDEAAFRKAEQAVVAARGKLDEALSLGDRNIRDPWEPWSLLYRNLAVMGRWEEALAQAQEFVSYARQQDKSPDRYSAYYWGLTDLASLHEALGDYDNALACHQESLRVGREYQEWFHRTGHPDDPRPHTLDAALACTLAPRFWALSTLAAAEGDQEAAWGFHNQAGEWLVKFFQKDCVFRNLNVSPNASLYELCMAVAAIADRLFETPAVLVRQHLLHQARLLRLDRDPKAAAEALQLIGNIPDYPHADDFRQDFSIRVERVWIEIARGDFAAALDAADDAGQHAGPRDRGGFPDQPSIGVLSRAELRFLRGVALAGLDPEDSEALSLVESAIEAMRESAATLSEAERERFLDRFADWDSAADRIRGQENRNKQGT